jgi:hypothetical protein
MPKPTTPETTPPMTISSAGIGSGCEPVQGDGRIGAERKERGGAEIHVAAIAAKDVPRRREHDVLQHDVAGEEIIVVAERDRGGEYDAADDRQMRKNRFVRTSSVPTAGRPHRQREQQKSERHGRRPGRPVECRGQAFDDADQHGGDHGSRQAAHAAEHADREYAADIFAADRRLDRLDDDEKRAGERGGRDRDAEGDALDADRVDRHQLQRELVLRHRHDRAADEGARQHQLQHRDQQQRHQARHQKRSGMSTKPKCQVGPI